MSLQVATEDLGVNRRSHIVMVARVLAIVCRRKRDVDTVFMGAVTKHGQFPRKMVVRVLTEPSTPETRQKGAELWIKEILNHPDYNKFLEKRIDVVDVTGLHSLDDLIMNNEIDELLKLEFDDDVLDGNFAENYPVCAKFFFGGQHVSEFAKTLGFPL